MTKPLRILYAAGPGDVIGTYRHWKEGRDDSSQVAMTYSGQFYDFCRESGASGYIISHCPRREKLRDGNLKLEHRPQRFARGPALLWHLGLMWYGLRLLASAVRFRADVAVVSGGTHWFMLGLFPWFGVKVVPTLHCVLWLKNRPPGGGLNGFIHRLNCRFFRNRTPAVMSLSNDITQQVRQMTHTPPAIVPFLPSYRPESFGDGLPEAPQPPPFYVFYAGRIERNKGVFDLLEIAKRFAADGLADIEFDLCGGGGAIGELKRAVEAAGLSAGFRCHGHVPKPFMRQMYDRCHVVIVPTTTDFIEGFNKVVAEGVLAGRPVVTSSVCPALEYVRDAVIEVPPDDVNAYAEALLRLRSDDGLRESLRAGCVISRAIFYDPLRSWKAGITRAVKIALGD